jgi:hypothetical protein
MFINTAMCNILLLAVQLTLEDEIKPGLIITRHLEAASADDNRSRSRCVTFVLGHEAMGKV